MDSDPTTNRASSGAAEVRDMYAALLQGELSGTDALAASQQMLQILMQSMTDAVFWKDRHSRYLGCNQVYSSFSGFDPAIILGKSDLDMPWVDDPEYNADWFIDWDQKVIESGEPCFGILERLRRSDGEMRWIETNKVPLRGLDGEVMGILGMFKDVTDRRAVEVELHDALEDLDQRVNLRTSELTRANETLRREVADRIRLQAEERQQREYAEALRDTAAAISETFDPDGVAQEVLAGVQRLVSNDFVAILLARPDGSCHLGRYISGFGYLSEDAEVEQIDVSTLPIVERLMAEPEPVQLDDPSAAFGPARSVVGVRIQVADQLVGILVAESATFGFFSIGHADRLAAVADQAGAALSNSQLASRTSELAAAEERQRLARDLHDAVNQTLWTAALTAESVLVDIGTESPLHQRLDRLRQLTRGALAEMRALLLELRPSELTEVGLDELVRHLLDALECRRTLQMTVDLQPVELDPDVHVACYRIAQEALSNVAQHANANSLKVSLAPGPPFQLLIEDDGAGFDCDGIPGGHFGVTIMRERAEAVGAELSIESTPGSGTQIRVRIA